MEIRVREKAVFCTSCESRKKRANGGAEQSRFQPMRDRHRPDWPPYRFTEQRFRDSEMLLGLLAGIGLEREGTSPPKSCAHDLGVVRWGSQWGHRARDHAFAMAMARWRQSPITRKPMRAYSSWSPWTRSARLTTPTRSTQTPRTGTTGARDRWNAHEHNDSWTPHARGGTPHTRTGTPHARTSNARTPRVAASRTSPRRQHVGPSRGCRARRTCTPAPRWSSGAWSLT